MKKVDLHIKNTVGYNLLKDVFLLYIIIAIIITLLHMYSEFTNEKSIIQEDMISTEKIFAKQLASSIWEINTTLSEDIIEGILTSRSIIGLSIKFNDTKRMQANFGIVSNQNKITKNYLLGTKIKVKYQNDLYSYVFDLKHNKKKLASVTLFSSKNVIYTNVKNNFVLIFINSIIKTFALWLIFLFFANKYLTKPFFEIIKTLKEIDINRTKELNFKYNTRNKDEFNILKKSFEIMFKRLQIAYEKLNAANNKNVYLNKSLEEKVLDRTQELEESNDELEISLQNLKQTQKQLIESEKMASLGGLVAGVAHEINTPIGAGLSGISHFLERTKEIKKDYEADKMSAEEFEKYLSTSSRLAQMININLERTAQLVKSFKQIAVDQTNEEKRDFNLKEYLNKIIFSLSNITKTKNIEFNIICKDNFRINSYPGLFSQIITNLIMNSINHGFKENNEGKININISNTSNSCEIIYKDNGIGIEKEYLKKIFEPFFTTNRENGGTGLGMSIVFNIVTNNLQGTIECKSEVNKGVVFTITLPLNLKST